MMSNLKMVNRLLNQITGAPPNAPYTRFDNNSGHVAWRLDRPVCMTENGHKAPQDFYRAISRRDINPLSIINHEVIDFQITSSQTILIGSASFSGATVKSIRTSR